MKNYTKDAIRMVGVLSVLFVPMVFVFAADITQTSVIKVDTGLSVEARSGLSGATSTESREGIKVNAGSVKEVTSSRDVSSGQSSGKNTIATTTIDVDGDGVLDVAVIVRGWDAMEKKEIVVRPTEARVNAQASVRASAQARLHAAEQSAVHSVDELSVLAQAAVDSDVNIEAVEFEPETTEIRYRYPGKFFGFIPVRPVLRATVDSKGDVQVQYPWYEIFVRRPVASVESDISSETKAKLITLAAQGEIDAQAKAFVSLSNVLKAKHEVVADVDVEVDAN